MHQGFGQQGPGRLNGDMEEDPPYARCVRPRGLVGFLSQSVTVLLVHRVRQPNRRLAEERDLDVVHILCDVLLDRSPGVLYLSAQVPGAPVPGRQGHSHHVLR